ncbi:795_t:CDS:1, partial [Racocetra persica]
MFTEMPFTEPTILKLNSEAAERASRLLCVKKNTTGLSSWALW